MKERTRLKMAQCTCAFLALVTIAAMYLDKDTIATTSIAGILTIVTIYIGGDSYRASGSKEDNELVSHPEVDENDS